MHKQKEPPYRQTIIILRMSSIIRIEMCILSRNESCFLGEKL